MRRVLFAWKGREVFAYPAMLYVGMTVGVIAGTRFAIAHGLHPLRTYAALVLLAAMALLGARLLFVAIHWPHYKTQPSRIWRRSEGGYALYGGLVLALLISAVLLPSLKIPVAKFWDAGAITILIGMIFTRIGCFLNGCCAGRAATGPLSFYLPNARGVWERRLPSQLFEAGFAALLLFIALVISRGAPRDGAVFLISTASYASGRWLLESTREGVHGLWHITPSRAISGVLAFASLVLLGMR
jgi:prolipoprotein diacylglyceryl transferase